MNIKRVLTISLITLLVLSPVFFQACNEKRNTVPTALFTITPPYGGVDTIFVFDASEVRDIEDPSEELEVRWDWESDSIFDTQFSTVKVMEHKFSTGGTFYITVEVKDTKGLTARKTDFLRVAWTNRPPNAKFVVNPEAGYLQDIFVFDASSSNDPEDDNNTLNVRWDFDGDGTWDTDYSTVKTSEHQYNEAGEYNVLLEVKDSEGEIDVETYLLVVGGTNMAPETPQNLAPVNEDNMVSTRCLLEWACEDPDNDVLVFDVYFGTGSSPAKVASDVEGYSYQCLPIEFSTEYYWKIVAKDPYDHVVSSDLWRFTTNSPVNDLSEMTDPRDGKKYKTITINGKLWMAENLNVGTMIHASSGGDFGDGYQKDNGKSEKFCYANKLENCDIYGGLYQWDEAMGYSEFENAEGICPPGWHVPRAEEYFELMVYYRDEIGASPGDQLVWGSRSGFEMLFSGYLIFAERKYYDIGQAGYFWTSTINPAIDHLAMVRSIYNGKSVFQEDTFQRVSGLPVRCLKDY